MLTCKHPWQNLDEIQTLWRLGRFDSPPLPTSLSIEAKGFLDQTFKIDPVERPTAIQLLGHEFCLFNLEDLDFRAYKEAAILKKKQMEEEEDSSDSEDESSEADSDEDDLDDDEDEDEDGI